MRVAYLLDLHLLASTPELLWVTQMSEHITAAAQLAGTWEPYVWKPTRLEDDVRVYYFSHARFSLFVSESCLKSSPGDCATKFM